MPDGCLVVRVVVMHDMVRTARIGGLTAVLVAVRPGAAVSRAVSEPVRDRLVAMRISLPSGTPAEIDRRGGAERGVVVAPDIFGLRPLFDDFVAGLAEQWGAPVIAVEPFPGLDLGPEVEGRFAAVPGLRDADHLRDLLEAADELGTRSVALIGFCMGGMYCFKSAASERFARIASFYGMIRVPPAWASDGHGEPLELLRDGHPERVLAIIGGRDPYTPPDDVAALRATGVVVREYPDAEHGFAHDANRPAHRAADAADAFAAARDWLLGA